MLDRRRGQAGDVGRGRDREQGTHCLAEVMERQVLVPGAARLVRDTEGPVQMLPSVQAAGGRDDGLTACQLLRPSHALRCSFEALIGSSGGVQAGEHHWVPAARWRRPHAAAACWPGPRTDAACGKRHCGGACRPISLNARRAGPAPIGDGVVGPQSLLGGVEQVHALCVSVAMLLRRQEVAVGRRRIDAGQHGFCALEDLLVQAHANV